MSELFLAKVHLKHRLYMRDEHEYSVATRLVRATNEQMAEKAVREHYEIDDPYGASIDVEGVEITDVLEGS